MTDGRPDGQRLRIEGLRVERFRALYDVELSGLSPLTAFLGPNGSGKSTIFDVFAFLSECFASGLRTAWEHRGRFKELRTRGADGPIVIELTCREASGALATYHLAFDEGGKGPWVVEEWLEARRASPDPPVRLLDFRQGVGAVIREETGERVEERLDSPDTVAAGVLGQLAKYPRIAALRRFISDWYLPHLGAGSGKSLAEAGPHERLDANGDNLPNVIQHLKERDPERLRRILETLAGRVPRLEMVIVDVTADGKLLLQVKDAPFARPIPARFASEGTLKLLAYLTLLYDPDPPALIGIEEPENDLHPRLLPELAEECRQASSRTQLFVTSHSPFFVNALRGEEVWVLYRDERGHTQARRTADMRGIPEFLNEGALLGDLWVEGHFEVGDPLTRAGSPKAGTISRR